MFKSWADQPLLIFIAVHTFLNVKEISGRQSQRTGGGVSDFAWSVTPGTRDSSVTGVGCHLCDRLETDISWTLTCQPLQVPQSEAPTMPLFIVPHTQRGQHRAEGQEGSSQSRRTSSSVALQPKTCTCCNYRDQGRAPRWQGLCPERGLVRFSGWPLVSGSSAAADGVVEAAFKL